MAKFIITTDSSCDCAIDELRKNNIPVIFFNYSDEKQIYKDTMDVNGYKKFYEDMRNGSVFKTSQINPQAYYDFFKPLLKEQLPIIHVSLGSGLSNTINSIYIASSMLKEDYPTCDIKPLDSKIASLGLTVLINKLIEYRDADMDVDDALEKISSVVDNGLAYFTTDTLTYFARGGRLSKVGAFLGNALKINPVLDVDPKGCLRITDKVRGSIKAIDTLTKRAKLNAVNPQEQTVYVCHADDENKARLIGKKLVDEVGVKDYKVYFMGPIIGAHTGPGLVAVFFFGKERENEISSI